MLCSVAQRVLQCSSNCNCSCSCSCSASNEKGDGRGQNNTKGMEKQKKRRAKNYRPMKGSVRQRGRFRQAATQSEQAGQPPLQTGTRAGKPKQGEQGQIAAKKESNT